VTALRVAYLLGKLAGSVLGLYIVYRVACLVDNWIRRRRKK